MCTFVLYSVKLFATYFKAQMARLRSAPQFEILLLRKYGTQKHKFNNFFKYFIYKTSNVEGKFAIWQSFKIHLKIRKTQ